MTNDHDCENCAELADKVEQLTDQVTKLDRRMNDVDDWRDYFGSNRVPSVEEETDVLHQRINELESKVRTLEEEMETFTGIAEDERSTPAKREADLRSAMIRAARDTGRDGVKWWKDEVAEHLAALGHEDLHKPDIYDAMEGAAEAEGFDETTKHVRKNNRQMEVRAIRLKLDELPGSEHGREITTGDTPADAQQSPQNTAELD